MVIIIGTWGGTMAKNMEKLLKQDYLRALELEYEHTIYVSINVRSSLGSGAIFITLSVIF